MKYEWGTKQSRETIGLISVVLAMSASVAVLGLGSYLKILEYLR